MRQLQVFGQLNPAGLPLVQAYRDLVRAERWREDVMLGRRPPGFVLDDIPAWMQGMINALELTARGEDAAADSVREQALDTAPSTSGHAGDTSFDWIADSDSRLGTVYEIMTAGSYRWLPLDDIATWTISAPTALIDLVWAPCTVTLRDGTLVHGFTPSRYPLPASLPGSDYVAGNDRDVLHLGCQTVWHETGRTGVIAQGRKCWTTSAGDVGLFDWLTCSLVTAQRLAATQPATIPQ